MNWKFNDGGRKKAGYKGRAGDCAVRAIAIASQKPYKEIYDLVNKFAKKERIGKRKTGISSARNGVYNTTFKKIMLHLGFKWQPTMKIGSGCTVHLKADELPKGRIVCNVSRHYVAVIDGVIQDTYDPSRNGTRCVYGYFYKDDDLINSKTDSAYDALLEVQKDLKNIINTTFEGSSPIGSTQYMIYVLFGKIDGELEKHKKKINNKLKA